MELKDGPSSELRGSKVGLGAQGGLRALLVDIFR